MVKKLVIIYFFLITPLLIYNVERASKLRKLKQENLKLALIEKQVGAFSQLRSQNRATIERFKDSDPNYLFKQIEGPHFNHQKPKIIETPDKKNSFYKDSLESAAQPISVDLKDIQGFLEIVELRDDSSKPRLFFLDFHLKKGAKGVENNRYALNFKIIKREYS